jgi:hypothetical protein
MYDGPLPAGRLRFAVIATSECGAFGMSQLRVLILVVPVLVRQAAVFRPVENFGIVHRLP